MSELFLIEFARSFSTCWRCPSCNHFSAVSVCACVRGRKQTLNRVRARWALPSVFSSIMMSVNRSCRHPILHELPPRFPVSSLSLASSLLMFSSFVGLSVSSIQSEMVWDDTKPGSTPNIRPGPFLPMDPHHCTDDTCWMTGSASVCIRNASYFRCLQGPIRSPLLMRVT